MKFNREALIKSLEDQIARVEAVVATHNEGIREREIQQREEYITETEAAWGVFCNRVLKAVGEGEPVTRDLAPKAICDRYGSLKFYVYVPPSGNSYGSPQTRNADAETRLWRNAVAVLKASTDEFVTSASLKDSGIRNFGALIGGN